MFQYKSDFEHTKFEASLGCPCDDVWEAAEHLEVWGADRMEDINKSDSEILGRGEGNQGMWEE